jgi:hypothetical protein
MNNGKKVDIKDFLIQARSRRLQFVITNTFIQRTMLKSNFSEQERRAENATR